jgi:predicted ATPase
MSSSLNKLRIKGFKSIESSGDLNLGKLNVLVGANGAGKSNFVDFFRMLRAMVDERFQVWVNDRDSADGLFFLGPKYTSEISVYLEFGSNSYEFKLAPTQGEKIQITEEWVHYLRGYGPSRLSTGVMESQLKSRKDDGGSSGSVHGVPYYVYDAVSNWMVYHFHDTGAHAPMRRTEILEDHYRLREDASNIAPFLYRLKNEEESKMFYKEIVDAVRLVIPFFDDFRLDVIKKGEAEKVGLSWQQKGSDFPMQAYHLSDGSIRFICLATTLLQPNPPSTIVIDEPELGLHPEAIRILGELIQNASKRTQIIVATQSPLLLDQFAVEDIITVNRRDGQSVFERLNQEDYSVWLEDYSVGELWTKNVIQGGTTNE